ncbi:MAG: primosomal protein N' [Rhodocyclaceae bacterium]|nr:primosomal protein N' [Rhodocyclaceae bacterium]
MAAIVRVALPLPLPRLFDYSAPQALNEHLGRRVRVPWGRSEALGLIWEIAEHSEVAPEKLRAILGLEGEQPALPADWRALVEFTGSYYHAALGEVAALAAPGGNWPAPRLVDRLPNWLCITPAGRDALPGLAGRLVTRRLLARLEQDGPQALRDLLSEASGTDAKLAELMERGWVEAAPFVTGERPDLTPDQAAVLEAVPASGYAPFLLHGITGSGKTEIYLRLVERALAAGRQALVLVPEIALTPQLAARFESRFPRARIVLQHSGVAEGARARGFFAALGGHADLVLGTRLAVFTPLPRLALIVVDEEHDASFKQQEGVRYSARDLAILRASRAGVPIVLGSATPALESWQHARSKRYRLLSLARRAVPGARLPEVRLIDLNRHAAREGLSEPLLAALTQNLAAGRQSLVFLNRRGYAPVLACAACGWVSRCDHCSANRVLHLAERSLRCHHCGAAAPVPAACPGCGNQDIRGYGRGTQRIEEMLQQRFPQARILRLDRDSVRSARDLEQSVAAVRAHAVDILVGTQMLAKGHDFPQLTLVGVLNADASLHSADYRAPERLFAQLVQVAGRAGRAGEPGSVLVQTQFPQHPLFASLLRHDYPGFAAAQLAERRAAGFPPFAYHALLAADDPQMQTALDWLTAARALAGTPEWVNLFDPVPMRMTRLANRERAQLLVESPARRRLQEFLEVWVRGLYALTTPRTLRWHLDVDPAEI